MENIIAVIVFALSLFLRITNFGFVPANFFAAILGALTVVGFYFLIRKSWPKGSAQTLPLVAAFLLTINPWHILLSRRFWQLNCLLLGLMAVVFFFLHFKIIEKIRKPRSIFPVIFLVILAFLAKNYFLERYLDHFSAKFLFFSANWSNLNRVLSYQGAMYFLDGLFLFFGLIIMISKERNQLENLMLFWLFLSPLPALFLSGSLTIVSFNLVLPLIFITAEGVYGLTRFFEKSPWLVKTLFYLFLVGGYGFCLLRFYDLTFHRL